MRSNAISWRRVRALCIKETRQIVRDPSSWLIAVVIPLLLLFIFGYGINLDSSRLRVGILLEQQSEEALSFTHAMTGSPYIDATISDSRQELIQKMQAGKIRGLIVIPVDFAANMARANTDAPIQVITDGSEPNTANFVQGYAEGIWQLWQMQRAEDRGEEFKPLIDVQTRYWFNPAAISQHFIIPGAVTIIMTVIGAILTSLVIAREWERGTMEALLSTEVTRVELLLCKLIPYYFLGMLAMLLCSACWCPSLSSACRTAARWWCCSLLPACFYSARWGWGCSSPPSPATSLTPPRWRSTPPFYRRLCCPALSSR